MRRYVRQWAVRAGLLALCLSSRLPTLSAGTEPVIGLHDNTPRVHAFTNARIVIKPGTVLEGATLLIRDDSIDRVGTNINIPSEATVHDLDAKTIYPGLIDLYTDIGMSSEPQDSNSKGAGHWNQQVHAHRQASLLIGPGGDAARDLRACGFGAVMTFPNGGIFKGSGALILLIDEKPRQVVLVSDVAQAISLRNRGKGGYPRSLMGTIALIRQTLLDTQWYEEAWTRYRRAPLHQTPPETNLALAELKSYIAGLKPVVVEVNDELDILQAARLTREFGLNTWVVGCGTEYRRLSAVKETSLHLILPIDFPKAPDVSTVEKERGVSLRDLRHWDFAPENPARLERQEVEFVLTSANLKSNKTFLEKLRTAVKRGLSPDAALTALTTRPAEWLGMSDTLGTLDKGKLANFFITDGDLFATDTCILDTWVAGRRYRVTEEPDINLEGKWALGLKDSQDPNTYTIKVSGKASKPSVTISLDKKKAKAKNITYEDRLLQMTISGDVFGHVGWIRMTGMVQASAIKGHGEWEDGTNFAWHAERQPSDPNEKETEDTEEPKMAKFEVVHPEGAFGRSALPEQPRIVFVKNATLWTCGPKGLLSSGDILISRGTIKQVGKNLVEPKNALVLDAAGKHVTPGLIDDHSHIATKGGINESSQAVTAEVRIEDVINSDDISIYRQLAGGVTSACIIHGSANPIGGTYAVIKLKWGHLPEELRIHDAKPGIKFALGENVKGNRNQYPNTRMGVVEIIRDAFTAAKDYRSQWQQYLQESKKNKNLVPPRTNLRLKHLLEVLDGTRIIHCHSYRQDEIHAMLCLAEEIGIKFDVFIHVLEGYKVAEELRRHGAMATTFSDWWAYKVEAYDAIPYNGAILHNQGVVVSFNSDDSELARRLNTEAAKAVKYGGVPPEEALKFVTLNSAKHLFLEHRIGSLEPGKDADFVIWSDSPLSTYAVCEQTWIDGRKYFDIEEDKELRQKVALQRTRLIQKVLDKQQKDKKEKEETDPNEPDALNITPVGMLDPVDTAWHESERKIR